MPSGFARSIEFSDSLLQLPAIEAESNRRDAPKWLLCSHLYSGVQCWIILQHGPVNKATRHDSVRPLNHSMSATLHMLEEPVSRLAEASNIPIRFHVRSIFQVEGDDPQTAILTEVPVEHAWVKDYDAVKGQGPASWCVRWDVANWGLLAAYIDARRVAVCTLAHNTDGVNALEGRSDVACVWDLRVHPDSRHQGIGRQLFAAAAYWASARGCRELMVETQNVNVPACRFYQQQGCRLASIGRHAYQEFPEEIKLIWSLTL